jgi:hypothetical protein
MSANFEPIKIVTLDSNRTRQSPTASGLRLMYLKLSQTPADAWEQLFENQRRFPNGRGMNTMTRRATVEGNYIVVDCVPEEMERHLPELQHDVAVTNEEYTKYLQRVAAQVAQELEKQKEEKARIEDVKSRLNF